MSGREAAATRTCFTPIKPANLPFCSFARRRFDVATKNMIVILGKKEHKNVWRTLVGVPGMKGGGGEKKEKKGEQKKSKQTKKAPSSDGVVNSSQSFSKKTSEIMFDLD